MHPPLPALLGLLLAPLPLFTPAATLAAAPPRVVATLPDLGDTAVDPALTELRVEFDQDMDPRGMSICGGGPSFPTITGRPSWESPRTLVVPVSLEPARTYTFSVNCPAARNFRNRGGEPALNTPVTFATAASPEVAHAATTTPEANRAAVEALRRAIDDRYSHRDLRHIDWTAQIDAHADPLAAAATPGAFALALAHALAPARDPHLSILVGGARVATFAPMQPPNCDVAHLQRTVPGWRRWNDTVATGLFDPAAVAERTGAPAPGPVGYILISSWSCDVEQIRPAVDFVAEHGDAAAFIVDVRPNGGGDELTARRFASIFVGEPAVYSRNRTRDPGAPGGWTPVYDRIVRPAGDPPRFAGPVAVLMGPSCMSSNESFLLMMRTGAAATLIGEPSYGSSANPRPVELGNGVTLLLPSWQDMLPDGTTLEGRGILPDIGVRIAPDELGVADPVLDAALRLLRSPADSRPGR